MSTSLTDPASATVVVATHDVANWTGLVDAIRSVKDLQETPSTIIVAVDHNGQLAARIERELHGVTVVQNDGDHRGASATRNAGAAAASTPILVFLDDDEVAEPGWLTDLIAPFAESDVVGTGGRYVPVWDGTRPSWFPDELAWVVGGHHSGMPDEKADVRNVWSGNMAVRAEVFHAVNGFREGFGKSGARSRPEDTDLCIRMACHGRGGRWVYVPDARILHTVPARRSGFGFYLQRCFAEGAGKIDLRDALPDVDALDTERDYLRRTIPYGIAQYLLGASRSLARGRLHSFLEQVLRAGAVISGVLAAGAGAATAIAGSRRSATP